MAVPLAGRVSDSQLQRGPAALLSDRPPRLMAPRCARAEAQSEVRTDSGAASGRSHGHSRRVVGRERAGAEGLKCSTSGHIVTRLGADAV